MEEYHQITLDEWTKWKEDIRRKLQETAGNFVFIGYRLKQIRNSGMFGGAADIFEFAKQEYGLSKSTTSRFMAINDEFSEGGNSELLQEKYRSYSSSLLSEMLTLPDKDRELVTEGTTIRSIRELKKFEEEEKTGNAADGQEEAQAGQQDRGEPEPAETGPEEAQEGIPEQAPTWTPLEKAVIWYFSDKKDLTEKLMQAETGEEAEELVNPSGSKTFTKGIYFVSMQDRDRGVKYRIVGQQVSSMTWQEFLDMAKAILPKAQEQEKVQKPEKTAERQEETPVATSQQPPIPEPVGEEPEKEDENPEETAERQEEADDVTEEEKKPEEKPEKETEKARKPAERQEEYVATSQRTEDEDEEAGEDTEPPREEAMKKALIHANRLLNAITAYDWEQAEQEAGRIMEIARKAKEAER